MFDSKSPFDLQFPCPKCGSIPKEIHIPDLPSKFNPLKIDDSERYCPQCGDPLWEICFLCDGSGQISTPTIGDRFCKQCGRELRPPTQLIECSKCKGTGKISEYHICKVDNLPWLTPTVTQNKNTPQFPCPKCGSIPQEIFVPILPFKLKPLNIDDGEQYCPQCGASLWKICFLCDGSGQISTPTIGDRFCKQCGRELRPATQLVECSECKGTGKISENHVCKEGNMPWLTSTAPDDTDTPLAWRPTTAITEDINLPELSALKPDWLNPKQHANEQAESLVRNEKPRAGGCGIVFLVFLIIVALLRYIFFW